MVEQKTFFDVEPELPAGLCVLKGRLTRAKQEQLVATVDQIAEQAPWATPAMPRSGTPFRLAVTNAGRWGWWSSSEHGFGYVASHPKTGKPWPEIPFSLMGLALMLAAEAGLPFKEDPDSCLVNWYGDQGSLGLHRDDDERDRTAPIVSISLGDDCEFEFGGKERSDPRRKFRLHSGDVVVFGGPARNNFHGVTKVFPGTSDLLPDKKGRYNVTVRRHGRES